MRSRGAVRVPASSANLGPGFDALGIALDLYLNVEVEPWTGTGPRVSSSGVDHEKMPGGNDNLIARVLDRVAERRNRSLEPVSLKVHNEIPLARGLGSSSTAILAGISCYEILTREELDAGEIFEYAHEFEAHPDNLAAGLFGGLTVSATTDLGRVCCSKVAVPPGLVPVLVIPEFELATESARSALPEQYGRPDTVFNIQRAALVVAAMSSGEWHLLVEAMRDRIHQPYRARLIPGLERILELRGDGLLGVALSGAGPTVLALTRTERASEVGEKISRVFKDSGVRASFRIAKIDTQGRRFFQ